MTPFIAIAVVFSLLVLGFVFEPVIRRRRAVGATLVAASALTVALLYLLVGTPDALDASRRDAPQTLDQAIVSLERTLASDPRPDGWRLLADAYRAQGRMTDASRALQEAVRLQPRDPELLVHAAETRALSSQDRRFDAEAVALLQRALAIDPANERAGWFLGVAHRQAGRAAQAAHTWEALLPRVQPSTASALRTQIDEARREAGLPPLPVAAADARAGVTVEVDIDPQLRATLPADAVVFVIARQPDGPPMPVAARRIGIAELPATITLTDVDSPMPTLRLSQLPRVQVIARVSRSGTADARPGDAESAPASTGTGGRAKLLIDHVRR
jgi:cytochrome c-type biogenesis protein CcmH